VKQAFVTVLLTLLLGGCSTLGDWSESILGGDDNADPPAPLVDIESPIAVKKLWSTSVGVGDDKQFINLVPAVDESQIFVADRKGQVVAFDLETGKKNWSVKTETAIAAGPGVGEGLVLVGTSDAEVLALSTIDGTLLWKAEVSSEVLSVPRIDLDKVIVQTADGNVAALDAGDGHEVWMHDRAIPVLTLRGTSSPAVQHGLVVVGYANGKLAALSAEKGFDVWETSITIPKGSSEIDRMVDIDGDPIIVGAAVYVTTYQGRIAVVDIQNGDPGWTRDMSSNVGLGVDFSQVYVTDDQSHVWALSRGSGATEWKVEDMSNRQLTAPEPFEDYILVGDVEGYVHLLSRYDGRVAARVKVDSRGVNSKPLVKDGVFYVYGNSGKLAAYTLPVE
jgi:outer membrane protein assembly factor BamB